MLEKQYSLQISSCIDIQAAWKEKTEKTKLIQKIIQLDKGGHAIILQQDSNKSIRFLYLCLFMSKKNSYNLSTLISKMAIIKQNKTQIDFWNMSDTMIQFIGNDPKTIYQYLLVLNKKLEQRNYNQTFILQLIETLKIVDSLLILTIRAIADDLKMVNSLDCQTTLTLGQIQLIMSKFFVDKGVITNNRNKYVIFWPLSQIQSKFFKEKGVNFQTQDENYQQLCDSHSIKFQNAIMIQKVFSLLE